MRYGCDERSEYGGTGCDCSSCTDDAGFTLAVLEHLESELCIDRRRIHATGMSNGGRRQALPPHPFNSSYSSEKSVWRRADDVRDCDGLQSGTEPENRLHRTDRRCVLPDLR